MTRGYQGMFLVVGPWASPTRSHTMDSPLCQRVRVSEPSRG